MHLGFIGLGNMGAGMARNLLSAQAGLLVYDTNDSSLAPFVSAGARQAATLADLNQCDVLISMLPSGIQVTDVTNSLSNSTPKLFIDCSTIAVDEARERQKTLKSLGHTFVDAPVSGGVAAAVSGSLTFMVGAETGLFDQVRQILNPMAAHVFSAGGPGNGQAAKIANNMLLAISMLGTCEAFNLAERLGLDAQTFYDISSKASGQCWSMTSYCPAPGPVNTAPSNRNYDPGFTIAMMLKDLNLSQKASESSQSKTTMGSTAQRLYQNLHDLGYGNLDFSLPFDLLKKDVTYDW